MDGPGGADGPSAADEPGGGWGGPWGPGIAGGEEASGGREWIWCTPFEPASAGVDSFESPVSVFVGSSRPLITPE